MRGFYIQFWIYHIGEGGYEETEKKIQEALAEAGQAIDEKITKPGGVEDVDFSRVKSPEIYFGAGRNTYFGNGRSNKTGTQSLTEPEGVKANILYLSGDWQFEDEFAQNQSSKAKIIFRYQAKNVFLVANSDSGVKAQILLDGEPIGDRAGADVGPDGSVLFKEDRLYKLVEDSEYGEHTLEIIIEDSGVRAFAFTFG